MNSLTPASAVYAAASAALTAVMSAAAAGAAGYCVTCTGPDAIYVCEVAGMSAPAATGMQGQMLCIKQLAAEGGHKTCSVLRNSQGPCAGPLRAVAPPDAAGTTSAAAPPVQAPKLDGPVQKNALQAAGDGIATAAKKSWSCMASLFKDC
ncbi:MAG: hypothetical protein ABL908_23270 [Hyphomicrobium sp.]